MVGALERVKGTTWNFGSLTLEEGDKKEVADVSLEGLSMALNSGEYNAAAPEEASAPAAAAPVAAAPAAPTTTTGSAPAAAEPSA